MFTAETLQKFDREVAKYPADQKQSAVMACLALAQEEQGWLPAEARTEIRAEFSRMFARLRWPTKSPDLGRGLLKD